MGSEKNQVKNVAGTDVLCKTGHGILKAIYMTVPGDRTYVIRDGTTSGGTAIFNLSGTAAANGFVLCPYINTPFNTGLYIDNTGGTTGELLVVFE